MRPSNEEAVEALVLFGEQQSAAASLRSRGYKFSDAWLRAVNKHVFVGEPEAPIRDVSVRGELEAPDKRRQQAAGKTFVFTCAQNNTRLHDKFWESLTKYVQARDAELHVSTFVYTTDAQSSKDAKAGSIKEQGEVTYDERIVPFMSDTELQVAPGLVWCGDINIIPTRVNPLSSFRTYTKGQSGIIPHVKMRMDSVPTMKNDEPVFLYTTGTVTMRNYIQRIAGQVAEFHHVYGAIVVEVDEHGLWWARQINAEADGSFYDLLVRWTPDGPENELTRVAAITHGDIHIGKADHSVLDAVFKLGGIVDMLEPHEQFFHDTLDFTPRNHHNVRDPHFLWEMHKLRAEIVEEEFKAAATLLKRAHRSWSRSVVVLSNHDVAVDHWLKNTSVFFDPVNVEFWLALNLHVCKALSNDTLERSPFIEALTLALQKVGAETPVFVKEDVSYKVYGTGIEGGMHGHLGPNGARGSPANLRTIGKANTGHTHSAGIVDGVYTAGVYGKLDMGYNKGPSSWSHSMIVTYLNGKRAVLTLKNGKAWR